MKPRGKTTGRKSPAPGVAPPVPVRGPAVDDPRSASPGPADAAYYYDHPPPQHQFSQDQRVPLPHQNLPPATHGPIHPTSYQGHPTPNLPPPPQQTTQQLPPSPHDPYNTYSYEQPPASLPPNPAQGDYSFTPVEQRPAITMKLNGHQQPHRAASSAASVAHSEDSTHSSNHTHQHGVSSMDIPSSMVGQNSGNPPRNGQQHKEYQSVKNLMTLKEDKMKLEKELESAKAEIRQLKQTARGKAAKNNTPKLEGEVKRAQADLRECKGQLSSATKTQHAAESKVRELTVQNKQLQLTVASLESEKEEMKTEYEAVMEDRKQLRKQLQHAKDNLSKLESAKADWEAERASNAKELKLLVEEKKQAAQKAQHSDARYREMRENFGAIRQSKESVEKEKTEAKEKLKDLNEEIRTCRERSKHADERARHFKEQCANLKRIRNELESENAALLERATKAEEHRMPPEVRKHMEVKMRKLESLVRSLTQTNDREIQRDQTEARERRARMDEGVRAEVILEELEESVLSLRQSNRVMVKERDDMNAYVEKILRELPVEFQQPINNGGNVTPASNSSSTTASSSNPNSVTPVPPVEKEERREITSFSMDLKEKERERQQKLERERLEQEAREREKEREQQEFLILQERAEKEAQLQREELERELRGLCNSEQIGRDTVDDHEKIARRALLAISDAGALVQTRRRQRQAESCMTMLRREADSPISTNSTCSMGSSIPACGGTGSCMAKFVSEKKITTGSVSTLTATTLHSAANSVSTTPIPIGGVSLSPEPAGSYVSQCDGSPTPGSTYEEYDTQVEQLQQELRRQIENIDAFRSGKAPPRAE
eukprot:TRINITY_DN46411_c0_g1_i1.p1 TRINITY_DN46411_c0_g1~~TRINITY_DN46411_c0_g1_i1.p1  ORF type:complete len:834 (-),score=172.54 TRINITY_DN46411_c0_g1_i1:86-2587(-)